MTQPINLFGIQGILVFITKCNQTWQRKSIYHLHFKAEHTSSLYGICHIPSPKDFSCSLEVIKIFELN